MYYLVFFFNDTATTEIYTLSLHDALPISARARSPPRPVRRRRTDPRQRRRPACPARPARSEEHTSELQSRGHLVCRLLLEKKKKQREKGPLLRPQDEHHSQLTVPDSTDVT